MARYPIQFQSTDQQGALIIGGTVTIYETGASTSTVTCYTASSGGTAVSGAAFTTDNNGRMKAWIDESDYVPTQLFRVELTGNEFATETWDDVVVFPVGWDSLDTGTVLYDDNSITVDTGGGLDINLGTAPADDFTVDTTALCVSGDSGDIGMGTATPEEVLHILHSANAACSLLIENTYTNGNAGLRLRNDAQEWVVQTQTTDDLYFYDNTGLATRMALKALTGFIGIGTVAPEGLLHISTSAASAATPSTSADDLVIENSTNGGITIAAPTSGNIFFSDGASGTAGTFKYEHATDEFKMATATGTTSLTLDSNGQLILGLQTITIGDGGTETQTGSRGATVTLNAHSGQITTTNDDIIAGAEVSFTVNNDKLTALDVVVVNIASGSASLCAASVSAVSAGSMVITLTNLHSSLAETNALVLNFVILRGASS